MHIDNPLRQIAALLIALLPVFAQEGHTAGNNTILVVGDSLSSGYRLQPGEGWVDLLAQVFARDPHRGITFVNDSISGDTTAGGVARLPAALRRVRPQWVIIELGGNDGLRGGSLEAMEKNLREMVRLTREQGAKPLLFGMKLPPNYGERYTRGFELVYQRVAAATDTPLLPFFLRGTENDFRWFQDDRIHPNAEAQPIIAENVRAFLEGVL